MPDPGYGPNGVRRDGSGLIAWEANGPPISMTIGDDMWTVWPLGVTTIPFISISDDEAHTFIYLGGAP